MSDTEDSTTELKHDNKTITIVTTALVAVCNVIPVPLYQKISMGACPCVTLILAYCFVKGKSYCYHSMERKRAMETYKIILEEQNLKLANCKTPAQRNKIEALIEKYETDRDIVRIKHTRKFI